MNDRDTSIGHLAILVVYFLHQPATEQRFIELHLERIARHTTVPYTIFATAARLPERVIEVLRADPHVVLCDIPPTDARHSREHGYFLDRLLPIALASGATHVCTLDVDSFPIVDGWHDTIAREAPPASGFAGVLRNENGDTALPHPSCTFATRAFYEQHDVSFSPDTERTPEFRSFTRSTGQPADTGIRVGSLLWNEGLPWAHLVRTNVVDAHWLMAGIYGDVIFHFGGVGLGKVHRGDGIDEHMPAFARRLERVPIRSRRLDALRARFVKPGHQTRTDAMARNRAIHSALRTWLFEDDEGLLAYLRGEPPTGDDARARIEQLAKANTITEATA